MPGKNRVVGVPKRFVACLLVLVLVVALAPMSEAHAASGAATQAARATNLSIAATKASASLSDGWHTVKGKRYYYQNGKPLTGPQIIKGKGYLFDKKGVMQTGLKRVDGYRCYFNKNGTLLRNSFKVINGKRYYFTGSGAMADIGLYKGYLIAYNGVCLKVDRSSTGNKDADARRVARLIAKCCGPKGSQSDLKYVSRAAWYVSNFCAEARYTTSGSDYYTAYGVFIAKQFSCAGSTRALGLVLDYLGYRWMHVNPNQWKHQWCRLQLDGKTGYADAAMLPTGVVGYGLTSPVAN